MIDKKAMQQMLSYVRRAVYDYDMIQDGDRIAVGVSGGKDSLTLLAAMKGLSRFYDKHFEVEAVMIDMGFDGADFSPVKALCDELGCELKIFKSDIKEIVFDVRKEEHPCSLCANLRRGALHDATIECGCNKVALGHHFDDVVETFYMNLFNGGHIGCFSPVTYMSRKNITVIRPLIYAPEKDITHFVRVSGITPLPKLCPNDGFSDRERVKKLLHEMEKNDPGLKMRLFGALERAGVDGFKVCPRAVRNKRKQE